MHIRSNSPSSGSDGKRRYVRHATAEEKLAARRASNRRSNAKRKLETEERNRRMASRVVELEGVLRSLLPHLSGPSVASTLCVLGRDRDLVETACPMKKKRKGNSKKNAASTSPRNRLSQLGEERKNPAASEQELKQDSVARPLIPSLPSMMSSSSIPSMLPTPLAEEETRHTGAYPMMSARTSAPMSIMADQSLFANHDHDMLSHLDIFDLPPQPLARASSLDFLLPDNLVNDRFGPSYDGSSDDLEILFGGKGAAGEFDTDLSDTQRLPPDRWSDDQCSWPSTPSSSTSESPSLSPRPEVDTSTLQLQVRQQFQEFVKQASTYLFPKQQERLWRNAQQPHTQSQQIQVREQRFQQQAQFQRSDHRPQAQSDRQLFQPQLHQQRTDQQAQSQSQRMDHPPQTDPAGQTQRIQPPQSQSQQQPIDDNQHKVQRQTDHQPRPEQPVQQQNQQKQQLHPQKQQQQQDSRGQEVFSQVQQKLQKFRQQAEQHQQHQQLRQEQNQKRIELRLQQQQQRQPSQISQISQLQTQQSQDQHLQSQAQAQLAALFVATYVLPLAVSVRIKKKLSSATLSTPTHLNHHHQQLPMTLAY